MQIVVLLTEEMNMRKILLVTTVLFLSVFTACKNTVTETVYVPVESTNPDLTTTVMVYMIGSNLLDGAENNIASMLESKSSDKLNVVIQTGAGNPETQQQMTEAGTELLVDWTKVNRYTVKDGKLNKVSDFTEKNSSSTNDEQNINMITTEALTDFLNYSKKNYPADRYMLILWNHGAGPILGYGHESSFGNNTLSLKDLYDVLKNADIGHYDLIGFDACLMGSVEVANTLKPFTDYLLGSEEIEPGEGWSYKEFLTELANTPNVPTQKIGKIIADNYLSNNKDSSHTTLSLIETTDHNMKNIITALDAVATSLLAEFGESNPAAYYNYIRSKVDSRKYYYDYLVDGIHFAEQLNANFFGKQDSKVFNLINAYRGATSYNIVATDYQEGSNGLTIYAPLNDNGNDFAKYGEFYNSSTDYNMNFSSKYIEFLNAIFDYQEGLETTTTFSNYSVSGSTVNVDIESALGFEVISVVADMEPNTVGIQAATAGVVTDWQVDTTDYTTYTCSYTKDNNIFGLGINGDVRPLYLTLNKKIYHNREVYEIHMPAYMEIGGEGNWTQGELVFKYDIDNKDFIPGVSFAIPDGVVTVSANTVIGLADVVFDSTNETAPKTITRAEGEEYTVQNFANNFTYTPISSEITGTPSYAFEVIDVLDNSHYEIFDKITLAPTE